MSLRRRVTRIPKLGAARRARVATRRRRSERGSTALITLFAMLISIVVFMAALNLIIDEYGKAAIRTAVDEAALAGSQQGAAGGPVGACQAKAAEVMAGLLNGPFAKQVAISCSLDPATGQVVATGSGDLPGWLTVIPAAPIHVTGAALVEHNPTAP
jgi:hypothetical protein